MLSLCSAAEHEPVCAVVLKFRKIFLLKLKAFKPLNSTEYKIVQLVKECVLKKSAWWKNMAQY